MTSAAVSEPEKFCCPVMTHCDGQELDRPRVTFAARPSHIAERNRARRHYDQRDHQRSGLARPR